MKTSKKTSTLILCILMSVSIAFAGQKGKDPQSGKKAKGESAHAGFGVFNEKDRDLIRHHYQSNPANLPPGLAKRGGNLPPGLEKQLQRNGHLPPGLEKKLCPFPVELEQTLPPLRPELIRGMIGGRAVIMDKKTSVILDVFMVL